ncbi:hypothetical protein [Nocardia flavorosea]|uniref:Uncharacterized protein n=1 Tax=Nocardia flavorosea TaxID=53429 RepID=A0A846YK28_9NOCA|nr:hypothetical protein [Nocardia flavorosea]NKY58141.1 hypothetical protein [Nocardia flavorosea]
MAINFKLRQRCEIEDSSTWGRSWVGWDKHASDQVNFEVNRGVWNLGARAEREGYATFSSEGTVVAVAEIDRIENISMLDGSIKQAIAGRALQPGDAGYDLLIGRAVDNHRNPVTYIPDHPDEGPRTCACQCGAAVTGSRVFLPGHDQKAVHDRIQRQWGSTVAFINWFDREFTGERR